MRFAAVLLVVSATTSPAFAGSPRYTPAQRYAGCLFGEAVPLMRRGMERERALAAASDRCIAWSGNLSSDDIVEVDAEVHRAIEDAERQGL